MDTVLGVDLEPRFALLDAEEFIDPGGAEPCLGPGIERQIDLDRNRRILEHEMARLVFLVVGK